MWKTLQKVLFIASSSCFMWSFSLLNVQAQSRDTTTFRKDRFKWLVIGGSAAYTVGIIGLNEAWYANSERTSFRFFNDNAQWKQVDKVGHFFSTYQISRFGVDAFRWTGLEEDKSIFWGSMLGVIALTPIEVLDGFSASYGFSWGDMIANTAGSAFVYGQYKLWDEIRIHPKFSFQPTSYASIRPEVLGASWQEEWLKDYNGQTYWLSVEVDKFLPATSNFPRWLNVAVGYGAQDMVYARTAENQANGYDAYRQYYLSVDFDWTSIRTESRFLKSVFYALNMIKLPAPTLEYNTRNEWRFHYLFF